MITSKFRFAKSPQVVVTGDKTIVIKYKDEFENFRNKYAGQEKPLSFDLCDYRIVKEDL